MRRALVLSLVCGVRAVAAATAAAAATPTTFYVSLSGSDAADGLAPSSPFATPARARAAIAALKTAHGGALPGPVTVQLAAGRYELAAPLTLTGADTDANALVTWSGGAGAVLSGAAPLVGWVAVPGAAGVWRTRLPDASAGYTQALLGALFDGSGGGVGGGRLRLRETPVLRYAALLDGSDPVVVVAAPGQVPWPPSALRAARVLLWHCWATSTSRLAAWLPRNASLVLGAHLGDRYCRNSTAAGARYALQNVLDDEGALAPGEFTFDPATRDVTLRPPAGGGAPPLAVLAPRLATVLALDGAVNVALQGFAVAHTDAYLEELCMDVPGSGGGSCNGQSGNDQLSGMVVISNSSGVALSRVEAALSGGYALWLRGGSAHVAIDRCWLHDTGGGGIRIGDGTSGVGGAAAAGGGGGRIGGGTSGASGTSSAVGGADGPLAHHIAITNCTIERMGDVTRAAAGILLLQASDSLVSHNVVRDTYHIAVSLGSEYGYGQLDNARNEVSFNAVYNVGRGELSDMGCIYGLGGAINSTWHHNVCHDVQSFDYGGWGLYADEGTEGLTIRDNVVHTTKSAGFHQHYGLDNAVVNNVLAFPVRWYCDESTEGNCDNAAVRSSSCAVTPGQECSTTSFSFIRNIILLRNASASLMQTRYDPAGMRNMTFDYNTYWSTAVAPSALLFPPTTAPVTFRAWQVEQGKDVHSGVDDPLFLDAEGLDFSRLDPASPALARGFVPIDVSRVGPVPE